MTEINLCNEVLENAIGVHRSLENIEPLNSMDAVAVQAMEELLKYRAIGTIEEFKALKEKSVPKKPNQVSRAMDRDKFVGLIGRCPNCDSIVAEDNLVCEDCFQVLDWSKEE